VKVFAYADFQGWGRMLYESLNCMDHEAHLFSQPLEVPDEEDVVCFIHMTHYGLDKRERDKKVVEELNKKKNILLIPTIEECRLYDDKVSQYHFQDFKNWMPETWHITNRQKAIELAKSINYPIVSKASSGAGSSNVRFLCSTREALREVELAFGSLGIPLHLKNKQTGYVFWQEFLSGNSNDWRVVLLAKKYAMVLKRNNRLDLPFASGSGDSKQITKKTKQLDSIMTHTLNFASSMNFLFLGTDIIYNEKGQPVILESTTGWYLPGYSECVFFEWCGTEWMPTTYQGKTMFDLVAKAILSGEFGKC